MEGAKIYAENAIRKKNESLQMLQLSSRIDGVASKLKSISAQRGGARSMGAISQQLGVAMQSMDTMAIAQNMDLFERQLGELDVQSTMIDATMATGSTATPVAEVESLMSEVAEEHGMNLAEQCAQPGPRPAATTHPCSRRARFADSRRWRRRERSRSLKRSLPRHRRMSCS